MDGVAIISVSAAVVTLTQLVKFSGLPDKWGPVAVLALSAAGVALWGWSVGDFQRTKAFEYFGGWLSVATAAAGIYGFVRAGQTSVMSMQAPPTGAGAEPPVRRRRRVKPGLPDAGTSKE